MDGLVSRTIVHQRKTLDEKRDEDELERWQLVDVEQLPDFLNDNFFLLRHHRPQLNSHRECFRSVFMIHTETLNIWTHLIGAMAVTLMYGFHLCFVTEDWKETLIFSLFFVAAITCMAVSATYHTLLCHSEPIFKLFAKLDYCGVILLTASSYFLWTYYSFYCLLGLRLFYMGLSATLACVCTGIVLQDKFSEPRYGSFRAGVFLALGLTSIFPGVHFLVLESFRHTPTSSVVWLLTMALSYLLGGISYAFKVPERYFPGKFDIFMHSHQVLHMGVVVGVVLCYRGALQLSQERTMQGC